ncbi:hypothetical protein NG99_04685 [Erwinia typographi]|uniref:Uncharacterized protein n=1 Tax=Erwinia typographi TaxID=371042 RepID=A0A0A4ABX2_9GAMM|nr:hypothetical protein [Erwinia typographi]KGT95318.1 hypothetical protein NG99_04685 [Erwinia typographi]
MKTFVEEAWLLLSLNGRDRLFMAVVFLAYYRLSCGFGWAASAAASVGVVAFELTLSVLVSRALARRGR